MGSVLALFRDPLNQPANEESSQVHFPPRSGCYFGSYFIMGGEHFNTGRNDAYMFGEPNDLTFLNRRPASFPYPAPAASEPSKTLQSLVNIRRDSVKLVKLPCTSCHDTESVCESCAQNNANYSLEFVLDADVPSVIRVLTSQREDNIVNCTRDPSVASWEYPAGLGQHFHEDDLVLTPGTFPATMFKWNNNQNDPLPLVIHVNVEDDNHAHFVFGVFEKSTVDNSFSVKVLKQKQNIDGFSFMLQEIYGMESKNSPDKSVGNGECVVCLNAPRDTMILPCRHLCLCYTCAEDVRFKSNACLMCRQPFRALLRIEALQRIVSDETDGKSESDEKYERVDLIPYKCGGSLSSVSRVDSSETLNGEPTAGPGTSNEIPADHEEGVRGPVSVDSVAVQEEGDGLSDEEPATEVHRLINE